MISSPFRRRPSAPRRFFAVALALFLVLQHFILFSPPTAEAAGTIGLSALNLAYTQNFDTLASTGTSSSVPNGWDFAESGTNANTTYTAGTGSGNGGDTYSFGATSNAERAFGGLRSGNLVPIVGASFTNNTGSTINSLTISYTGEQWREGVTNRGAADRLDFQISTNATSLTTGTYTDFDALDFSSPNTTAAAGALDGNAAANRATVTSTISGLNIASGATFFIRWTDFDIAGADDGLAIDGFSLTPQGNVVVDNPPTVTNTNPADNAVNVATNSNVNVTFSEPVNANVNSFQISCGTSGLHAFALSGGPTTFTLDPSTDFTPSEVCTVTVFAAQVTDQDGTPNQMTADFVFHFTVVNPTAPSGSGTANPASVQAGAATLLTVSVTPGANPTSTGITVTGDLSSIGGAGAQQFFDDATHGDAAANDNTFSFNATVSAATSNGSKSLPITITDGQGRTGNASIALSVQSAPTPAGAVVISQLYGGGGNGGATLKNDFIEIFNRSANPVDLTGWSVQYASAGGGATATWNRRTPLSGTINPGQYFLIQEAQGAGGTTDLPAADIIGTIAMGATDGKVALVRNNTDLPNGCPIGNPNVIDFVGYGTADCFEGPQSAPQLSNTTADLRARNGCKDTDFNGVNFTEVAPSPRNSSSPLNVCPVGDEAPEVFSTTPTNGATNVSLTSNITINFDQAVNVAGSWFQISCGTSGLHTATGTGGPTSFTLNPDTDFAGSEQCTVTVFASQVTDQDAQDPPDNMAADYVFSFTTLIPRDPNEHLVMGNPSNATADLNTLNNYLLLKDQYAHSYNCERGTPNWVSWHLDSSWVGTAPRQDDFRDDPATPAPCYRVLGTDYSGSGFDRGHMTPSADRTSSIPDNSATFFMTNMVPQAPDNNQGPWANLENYARTLLGQNELYIISGGVGTGGVGSNGARTTIAGGNVTVPAQTWKVFMILPIGTNDLSRVSNSTRTFAVILPNTQGIRNDDWKKYLATVDQVEELTGYDFFSNVDPAIQAVIESRLDNEHDTAPVADSQSVSTAEDTPKAITLTATDFNVNNVLTYTVVTSPVHGTLSGTGANLTYSPNADYFGTDSFTFKANDGGKDSNTATVSITVNSVNDAPVANDDAATTPEDTSVDIDVRANDSDVDGDTITLTSASGATKGGVGITGTGKVRYEPFANQNGVDSFTYTISDGNGGTATGTVSVTITSVNDAPVAVADTATTDEDIAVSVNVVANDTDLDGDTLTLSNVADPVNGTVVIENGKAVFTPTPNYHGAGSFSYTVSDGQGGTASANVTVTINSVNDNPVANNDSATTSEDTTVDIDVRANDTDIDGDSITLTSASGATKGGVGITGTGQVRYEPFANQNGTDTFTYTISDGNGGTASATVTVTINSVNDRPDAVDDSASTNEDSPVIIQVRANDTDTDGDALSVSAVTQGAHGSVANNGSSVTYTPNANFFGSDSFTYTISDGQGGDDTASVTVNVANVEDAPDASNDAATIAEDSGANTLSVLVNDTDPDGDALTVNAVTQGAHGSVVNNGNSVSYTPNANFFGTDAFTYTVGDGHGGADTATVNITITNVNDAPIANGDSYQTNSNTPLNVPAPGVLSNDSDIDGDALAAQLVSNVSHGTLALNANGSFTYTPSSNFTGTDSFTYRAFDGTANSNVVSVTITVKDTVAPTLTASVAVNLLHPPNSKFVNVGLTVNASDNSGVPANVQVFVFSDEDDIALRGGQDSPDAKDIAPGTLRLRAERNGDDGRVYLIKVVATDSSGNVSSTWLTVVVPKSNSDKSIDELNQRAEAARAQSAATGTPPAGYFVIGDGPVLGSKQ